MANLQVVPLKAALGARIEGLKHADAAKPEVAAPLNKALGEHLLVVVPGERMTPAEMRDFASAFGKPRVQLLRYKRSGDVPEVSVMVSTLMADGTTDKTALRSEDWHTDDFVHGRTRQGDAAAQHRDPEQGRHDLVLQHAFGLRGVAGGDAAQDRRQARRPRLRHGAGAQPAVSAHRSGDRRDTGRRTPPGAHSSGDGAQGALPQFQPPRPHRWHGTRGKRRRARRAGRRSAQARASFRSCVGRSATA